MKYILFLFLLIQVSSTCNATFIPPQQPPILNPANPASPLSPLNPLLNPLTPKRVDSLSQDSTKKNDGSFDKLTKTDGNVIAIICISGFLVGISLMCRSLRIR